MATKGSDSNGPWGDAKVNAELERLWALDGVNYLSAGAIANALAKRFPKHKFSKNAVLSRGNRMFAGKYTHRTAHGPGGGKNIANQRRVSRRFVNKASKTMDSALSTFMGKVNGTRDLVGDMQPVAFDEQKGGIRLMDAQDGQCRWPMADNAKGEPMCCGAATESKRVFTCAGHKRIQVDRVRTAAVNANRGADAETYGARRRASIGNLNKFR